MKIIHTSDWHLGRSLYGRKRYEESAQFLDWLIECIQQEQTDVLLVAGDIFDNSTPSNRALELYYRFLHRVAGSHCRHVIITAGNHDSPSLLNAPREVLRYLNVHVVGCVDDDPENEVLVLNDADENPELIVCAVPYLRDRDIRNAQAGESIEDKNRKLVSGIREHYQTVCGLAEARRSKIGANIPIIALGHLFTAGGQTVEGDGVRELYMGSLGHVGIDAFPKSIDYLGLGHLHTPQKVAGFATRRYCGSPIPISFGEARQQKIVLSAEFTKNKVVVNEITVPCFQVLETLSGSWDEITRRIDELKDNRTSAWLEILYQGDEIIDSIQQHLQEMTEGSGLEILRIKNARLVERALSRMSTEETLDDLSENDVFARCLAAHDVPLEQHQGLTLSFQEIVAALHGEDARAE
ncbi:MAG: exonuclease SbcCD subunit D C-terminal domain-containing protein [Deltaproteobacteria bacterium]|nr:exonuclease SbcCD subunit D C-terminal domain-containing protein [Deltaproteobacteria bacterium]